MSTHTIRILIAGALFVHGIGHTLGIWKPARSLPFLDVPESTLRLIGGVVWVLVAVGFMVSSMGFFGIIIPPNGWRTLAVVFAVISLVAIILFGRNWPTFNLIGAYAMNIATLVSLLWLHWPPFEMFNR